MAGLLRPAAAGSMGTGKIAQGCALGSTSSRIAFLETVREVVSHMTAILGSGPGAGNSFV